MSVRGPLSPFERSLARSSNGYVPASAGVFVWSMPSHVSTTEILGGSVLTGVATADSRGLRRGRKRMEGLEGERRGEDTSRIVAPSSSLGSWTTAENSSAPTDTV